MSLNDFIESDMKFLKLIWPLVFDWKLLIFDWKSYHNKCVLRVFWAKMMILNLLWFEIFKIDLTTMKWYLSGQYRIYKERSLVCWCCFHHYWMILLLWSDLVGTLNFPNHQLGKSKYLSANLRQICSRNF